MYPELPAWRRADPGFFLFFWCSRFLPLLLFYFAASPWSPNASKGEAGEKKGEEMSAQEDVNKNVGKRKQKQVFIYGNYKNYYGYRIDRNQKEDPRLMVMKREWFEGKDCLDIGCNQGLITIEIAKKFFCRSILGIDIDGGCCS